MYDTPYSHVTAHPQEEVLPRPADKSDAFWNVSRAAVKSTIAGLAGATLTNPFDVIRYEI